MRRLWDIKAEYVLAPLAVILLVGWIIIVGLLIRECYLMNELLDSMDKKLS